MHELWSKEGLGVKLGIWLSTTNPLKVESNDIQLGHATHLRKYV